MVKTLIVPCMIFDYANGTYGLGFYLFLFLLLFLFEMITSRDKILAEKMLLSINKHPE